MHLIDAIQGVFASSSLLAAAWGMAASYLLCIFLVLTKTWHGALTMDHMAGIQKFHTSPTPRIGGVPILLGLVIAWSRTPTEIKHMLTPIIIAGLPAFIGGSFVESTVIFQAIATVSLPQ